MEQEKSGGDSMREYSGEERRSRRALCTCIAREFGYATARYATIEPEA